MVFDGKYPNLEGDKIYAHYEKKYADTGVSIPKDGEFRDETLRSFRQVPETTYSLDDAEQIMQKAEQIGRINMNLAWLGSCH